MCEYAIIFAQPAQKEFEKLNADIINKIFFKIECLFRNPHPSVCR